MTAELLYFNGLRGDTGGYLMPPLDGEALSQLIRGEEKPENFGDLALRAREKISPEGDGLDLKELAVSGWGILFAAGADAAVIEALTELIAWRKEQAGDLFKLYTGDNGYRSGESTFDFLTRNGVGVGPVEPQKMPYYLLIAGSPQQIPYTVQYELDVQRAVGRIYFDSAQEYAAYAHSVVTAEKGAAKRARRVALFGTANVDDQATQLSQNELVIPLHQWLVQNQPSWQFDLFCGEQAKKTQLARLLGGDQTPALLFTATHGMSFPKDDSKQLAYQGALVCQEWPGPDQWKQAIPHDFYFAGDDLTADAKVHGAIALCFACYGAGTPLYDDFSRRSLTPRTEIAPHAFVAALPKRLLAHPQGGALAMIGHVERTWGYSFSSPGIGSDIATFQFTLRRLLNGYPVGAAMEFFNDRYAVLATQLTTLVEALESASNPDTVIDPYKLAGIWTAHNDARGYAIIGDPAVRLSLTPADG